MAIANPVEVYAASSPQEAQLLKDLLSEAGINAEITEDVTPDGEWMGVSAAPYHSSRMWVDDEMAETAAEILREYEQQRDKKLEAREEAAVHLVEARCEECGQISTFSAALRGTVQECPKCGASMDVGPATDGDWWKADGDVVKL
ncbi:putative signal transducing protein [Zavarzinella formosa]|uniref:putative signal transducing protein n=1 Tax=Zavarzinella formosa TaxID=360055 RepID=UPI0002E1CBBA|nr:DUF2007 domain-containing protein [Zavarzinella formosa]